MVQRVVDRRARPRRPRAARAPRSGSSSFSIVTPHHTPVVDAVGIRGRPPTRPASAASPPADRSPPPPARRRARAIRGSPPWVLRGSIARPSPLPFQKPWRRSSPRSDPDLAHGDPPREEGDCRPRARAGPAPEAGAGPAPRARASRTRAGALGPGGGPSDWARLARLDGTGRPAQGARLAILSAATPCRRGLGHAPARHRDRRAADRPGQRHHRRAGRPGRSHHRPARRARPAGRARGSPGRESPPSSPARSSRRPRRTLGAASPCSTGLAS